MPIKTDDGSERTSKTMKHKTFVIHIFDLLPVECLLKLKDFRELLQNAKCKKTGQDLLRTIHLQHTL